jgi:hypothetical protein
MPWTTPPTFSYGYPASVDDLNIIRNNLLYLYGQIYNTSSAVLESEVRSNDPFSTEATVLVLWVVHKLDNFYYRARLTSEGNNHNVTLNIRYYDQTGVTELGLHSENIVLGAAGAYTVFNNSGAAVDISGWSLSVDEIYKVILTVTASTNDNDYVDVELNYLYEG